MKFYTVYPPPYHESGIIHQKRMDAIVGDKPFNGKTTE